MVIVEDVANNAAIGTITFNPANHEIDFSTVTATATAGTLTTDTDLVGNHYINLWSSFAWAAAATNDVPCSFVTSNDYENAIISLGQTNDATHTESGVHIYVSGAAIIVAPFASAQNAADIYGEAVSPLLVADVVFERGADYWRVDFTKTFVAAVSGVNSVTPDDTTAAEFRALVTAAYAVDLSTTTLPATAEDIIWYAAAGAAFEHESGDLLDGDADFSGTGVELRIEVDNTNLELQADYTSATLVAAGWGAACFALEAAKDDCYLA